MAKHKTDEEKSGGGGGSATVRVVSYNLLSSHLADPKRFTKNRPAHLKAAARKKKIDARLEAEVKLGSVIALQEVPLGWCGTFESFFQQRNYTLVSSLYGSQFSDYMGVALAFPSDLFEMLDCSIARVGDTANFRRDPNARKPAAAQGAAAAVAAFARRWAFEWPLSVLKALSAPVKAPLAAYLASSSAPAKREESPYVLAQRRHNRIVFLRLRCRETGVVFCVASYHMPCMFYNPPVMTIHAALAAQYVQKMAGKTACYVLAGDFNFKPCSEMYRLVTEGRLEEDAETHPPVLAHEPWRPVLERPMRSAYAVHRGAEPDFTNYAQINDEEPFIETLDYLFCSAGVEVADTVPLPDRREVGGPLPNADEPSDHILIGATLVMRGDKARKGKAPAPVVHEPRRPAAAAAAAASDDDE